jgi:hypothetical protein
MLNNKYYIIILYIYMMSSSPSKLVMPKTNNSRTNISSKSSTIKTNSSKTSSKSVTNTNIKDDISLPRTSFNKTLKAIENYNNDKKDKNGKNISLKEEILKKINMYFIGFICIFLILIFSTSSIVINKYKEVCSKNPNLKNEMNFIYIIAILNIILTILFIISFIIIFFNFNVKFVKKYKNVIIYLLILIISLLNMSITTRFIKIRRKCYLESEPDYKSNWLWINYTLTLPICLLILILFYLYNKFKLEKITLLD